MRKQKCSPSNMYSDPRARRVIGAFWGLRAQAILLWGVSSFALPQPSWGEPKTNSEQAQAAKEHFLSGKKQYAAGKYEDAIRSFRAAEAIKSSPILDFNIGRCLHKLNRPEQAIAAYERYLAQKQNAANKQEVLTWIAELKESQKKAQSPADPYEELESGKSAPPASQPVLSPEPTKAEPKAEAQPEEVPHEASLSSSWNEPPQPPKSRTQAASDQKPQQPPPRGAPRDEGPVYKQWWFWVACVTGVVITSFIIATAVGSDDEPAKKTSGLSISF